MKSIAIGVDRGFGATKYCSELINSEIESLVAPITSERARDLIENNKTDNNVIIIKTSNDEFYLVGSYVSLAEPKYAERDLKRNRNSLNEFILFVTGMGLATGEIEECKVTVTTGLPTADFDKFEKSYSKSIENNGELYEFSIYRQGKEYKKRIKVINANIENQPKGTIISRINEKLMKGDDWLDLKSQKFGICDIGFNTTDLSMYVGKDIIKGDNNNFSTFGIVQIVSTIKKLVEDKYDCKKTEDDILTAMKTNKIKVKGKIKDCSEEVKAGFKTNAELLVNEISSKWEEYLDTLDEIILTGGALENPLFKEILFDLFKNQTGWDVSKPQNAQFANSYGYYLISASILAANI